MNEQAKQTPSVVEVDFSRPVRLRGNRVGRLVRWSETEGAMFALCRCGQSANKPFCDGTHKKADFEASETLIAVAGVGQ